MSEICNHNIQPQSTIVDELNPIGVGQKEINSEVDVCIISYAKNGELKKVTERGLESLLNSEDNIKFNIFVVESEPLVSYNQYPNTTTIYPTEPFGYNKYLNLAVKKGKSAYVVLCNNDLTFEKGWASEIIKQMLENPKLLSASPLCPQTQNRSDFTSEAIYGHTVKKELLGWCIFQKREVYKLIGKLNEGVDFWFSDNIYADQLMNKNVAHALVTDSVVNHHENNLGKTSSTILDSAKKDSFTTGQYLKYLFAKAKLVFTSNSSIIAIVVFVLVIYLIVKGK